MASQDDFGWARVIARVGLNALTHPVEYVKVLIQIGYEPLPTYTANTLFGKEKIYCPNVFKYVAHIKKVDGFYGCYRGLTAKLSGNIVGGLVFQKITESIQFENECDNIGKDGLTVEQPTKKCIQNNIRETAGRVGAIVVSQPLQVVAVRMMAEFVGKDGIYTGVIESIRVIYREEGVRGFFSGLIPKLICDIGALWIGNCVIQIINNYMSDAERDSKEYIRIVVRFITSTFMYPFQVVTKCMAVTNSGLVAGDPPFMRHYDGWYSCYKHLDKIHALKRGSSLIWRAYCGPAILSNGPPILITPLTVFE